MNLTYDLDIYGVLSALAYALDQQFVPGDLCPVYAHVPDLFSQSHHVPSDEDTAENLMDALSHYFDQAMLRCILYCAVSELPDIGMALWRAIQKAQGTKRDISRDFSDPDILYISKTARKVGLEVQRFKGLLRFSKLKDGTYYAPFEPDHNIALLLAPHFSARLRDQRWVLHDRKRHQAVLFDTRQYTLIMIEDPNTTLAQPLSSQNKDLFAHDEERFQALWKTFYDHIAIKERTNPRLQKQFMPKRYWQYLTERQ